MKGATKLFFVQLLIAFIFYGTTYSQASVSGTVRYIDNNEPVTTGSVKAYNQSGVLIATTIINSNGNYAFAELPGELLDLIGIPDLGPEEEDFIPTFFPDATDWQYAVPIFPASPLTNIDIYVQRPAKGGDNPFVSTIKGKVTLNDKPINDAIVYVKSGYLYYGYGITNSKGEYTINSIPLGDYILVVHRIGASSATRNVNLTMEGLTNVIFNLEEAPFIISNNTPKEFELLQNYPNPFNPATTIKYSVPVTGQVKMSVYNSMGQLVKELVNEVQTSGTYNVSFNGSDLASGVYLYRLEAGNYLETKKMILVK
jgi:hypothetical protein